jgi:hypothetical protein
MSTQNRRAWAVSRSDVQLDWLPPTHAVGGIRVYGALTRQPRLAHQPGIDKIEYPDGPLMWRGNAGVEWVREPRAVDLKLQSCGA